MGPALEDLRPYEQSMIPAMLLRRLRAALAVTPEETAKPPLLPVARLVWDVDKLCSVPEFVPGLDRPGLDGTDRTG
jgi:hypothetical protein